MSIADEHLARIASVLDDWDREDAAEPPELDQRVMGCARQDLALREALEPVTTVTLKLAFGLAPGHEAAEDASWAAMVALARRDVAAHEPAGVVERGLAARSFLLLDRIDALIGAWPDPEWHDLVRDRVQRLVDARGQGRARGQQLRHSPESSDRASPVSVAWLLRHPTDHYLCRAAGTVSDAACREIIEDLIGMVRPTYEQLCALDWGAQETAADLVAEVCVLEDRAGIWNRLATVSVVSLLNGTTAHQTPVAIRLVEDSDAPFNGTLVSFAAGERWLLCARTLDDGTLLPLDGTRRLRPGSGSGAEARSLC